MNNRKNGGSRNEKGDKGEAGVKQEGETGMKETRRRVKEREEARRDENEKK